MLREFDRLYATTGRPSIPPERLLRAQLLQVFYSIRSELLLMEQLNYNLLFRWFVGLTMDDPVWNATTFTKNRDDGFWHVRPHTYAFFSALLERPQRELASRSPRAEHIIAKQSGHFIQNDEPQLVIAGVRRILDTQ